MEYYTIVEFSENAKELKNGEFVQKKVYSDELCEKFDKVAKEWCLFIIDDVEYEHEDYGSRSECSKRSIEIPREYYLIQNDALIGCVINDIAIYFDENKNQIATKTYYCSGISRLESGYGCMTYQFKKAI